MERSALWALGLRNSFLLPSPVTIWPLGIEIWSHISFVHQISCTLLHCFYMFNTAGSYLISLHLFNFEMNMLEYLYDFIIFTFYLYI